MTPPASRRVALVAHIATSVGWFGAAICWLPLAMVALSSADPAVVRVSCLVMNVTAKTVLVPLALAALGTGILVSCITPWGLLRHYWVATKLALTLAATVILVFKTKQIDQVAQALAARASSSAMFYPERFQFVVHAGGGLLVLLVIIVISIFKPWGMTRWGVRSANARDASNAPLVSPARGRSSWPRRLLAIGVVVIVLFVLFHLFSRLPDHFSHAR